MSVYFLTTKIRGNTMELGTIFFLLFNFANFQIEFNLKRGIQLEERGGSTSMRGGSTSIMGGGGLQKGGVLGVSPQGLPPTGTHWLASAQWLATGLGCRGVVPTGRPCLNYLNL
jgi:hypothetical protein